VFATDWQRLVAHVQHQRPHLVLLPELPFYPWFASGAAFDPAVWEAAVAAHESWIGRLPELAPAAVATTVPVAVGERRLNAAVLLDPPSGLRRLHVKRNLPDEEGFREARWFDRGPDNLEIENWGDVRLGFLICSELWFTERARAYGRGGVHLILVPRATSSASLDRWRMLGRVTAAAAGAFCLSSNRVGASPDGQTFGGEGWAIGPEGDVIGLTSAEAPFVTVELDVEVADRAKTTYPRTLAE
jgi:N-carbamoylputrescine amidase